MLTDASITDPEVQLDFLKGFLFAIVLLPVGYRVLRWGVARSKKEGTLGWYSLCISNDGVRVSLYLK